MTKLIVEVLDASDLMPKDGDGSSSPFVEGQFDEQQQRTQTKHKDLNPYWNEKLVFNLNNPRDLPNKTIEVVVHNDNKAGHRVNFLGRVRISGVSVPLSEQEGNVQRYPLDKRGLFSHIKGDIALKIFCLLDGSSSDNSNSDPISVPPPHFSSQAPVFENLETPLQEIQRNVDFTDNHDSKKKNKNKNQEVRTFHSIGSGGGGGGPAPPPPIFTSYEPTHHHQMKEKPPGKAETRMDFAQAGGPSPATMMHMRMPKQNPEFSLVETSPPLAARLRYRRGRDKDC